MHNIEDYVIMVARSMGRELSQENIKLLSHELINSKQYTQVLKALELKILKVAEKKDRLFY